MLMKVAAVRDLNSTAPEAGKLVQSEGAQKLWERGY